MEFVGTFWALVPPIVAIVLALITKETYTSLFVGIVVGALLLAGFDPINTINYIIISGGEAQRTALARALILEPDILLLDEPFSALDPATKRQMYGVMRDVHARFDCTIVFVTHDFAEARILADRVGIVLGGRLRTVRNADRLFDVEGLESDVLAFLDIDNATR